MRKKARVGCGRPARTGNANLILPHGGCTLLPALQNIEGLLRHNVRLQDQVPDDTVNDLPELPMLSRSPRFGAMAESSRRLYGKNRIPDNTYEFNQCLRLPDIVAGKTSPVSRQASPDKQEKDNSPRGEGAGEPSGLRCIMLPQTFDAYVGSVANTVDYVASTLVTALQLPPDDAQDVAERCHAGDIVMLNNSESDSASSSCEARRIARNLREKGLIVRVTAKTSAEACSGSGSARTQQFAKKCSGRLRVDAERLALNFQRQQLTTERMRQDTDQTWKRDTDLKLKFVPEDAVDAFFKNEAQPRLESRQSLLKCMVKKHAPVMSLLRLSNVGLQGDADEQKSLLPTQPTEKRARKLLSEAWKEGCRLLRTFLFGCIGNEDFKEGRDKESIYYEGIGSKSQVSELYKVWAQIDTDGSGRVDINEFRGFAEIHVNIKKGETKASDNSPSRSASKRRNATVATLAMEDPAKFIQKLCERLEKLLLSKKSSFVIEDMMRLCWPSASIQDIKTMAQWCLDFAQEKDRNRIKPPQVMPKAEFEGLSSVYQLYDEDGDGLDIVELVKNGVIDEEDKQEWCKIHGSNITVQEFCELLCPAGFRATAQSQVGSLPDGRRVIVCPRLGVWRLASVVDEEPASAVDLS